MSLIEENQVIVSSFVDIEKEIKIAYVAEIYIPVLKLLVEESRKKITN